MGPVVSEDKPFEYLANFVGLAEYGFEGAERDGRSWQMNGDGAGS